MDTGYSSRDKVVYWTALDAAFVNNHAKLADFLRAAGNLTGSKQISNKILDL